MAKITTEELNKIKEKLLDSIGTLFKRDKVIDAVVILISQEGKMAFVQTPYTNNTEKHMMIEGVKLVCKKENPAAVAVINEAWIREFKGGREEADNFKKELSDSGKRISDFDDKKEVVMMMFETADSHEMIVRDIDRANNDLINEVRSNEVEGIFCNILNPIKTTA